MTDPLLQVENLRIRFAGNRTGRDAVRGVSFSVGREKLGIVGESGSGKSQTGRALMKLTPRSATVTATKLQFRGEDLLAASERRMRQIRGRHISMILQDPKFSLNPLMRVGEQIVEAYRVHHKASQKAARDRALKMLEAVHMRSHKLDGSGSSRSSFARRRGKPHVNSSVARPTTFGDAAISSVRQSWTRSLR